MTSNVIQDGIAVKPEGTPDFLWIHMHGMGDNAENNRPLIEKYHGIFPQAHIEFPYVAAYGAKTISPLSFPKGQENATQEELKRALFDEYMVKKSAMTSFNKVVRSVKNFVIEKVAVYQLKKKMLHGIVKYIEAKQKETGLPAERTIISGFSMGAGAAIYAGLLSKNQVAGIVSHSGGYLGQIFNAASKPPILFIADEKDIEMRRGELLDIEKAVRRLKKTGVDVDFQILESEAPHVANYQEREPSLGMTRDFISKRLAL